MKFKKFPFRQNWKLQFAAIAAIGVATVLLFLFGWEMEGKSLTAELPRNLSAIEAIKSEAAAVKSARDDYFRAIGKGNGGAYDRYQDSKDCLANLDLRLISLKNLRNDFRRLLGEIGLREQEMKTQEQEIKMEKILAAVEEFLEVSGAEDLEESLEGGSAESIAELLEGSGVEDSEDVKFLDDVAKMAEEVFDVEGLKEREAAARVVFEEDTISLVNCLETFGSWENCEEERVTFLETREFYLQEISEMKTDVDLSKIEAEKRLEEMLEEYNLQTSGLLNKIQPKLLMADTLTDEELYKSAIIGTETLDDIVEKEEEEAEKVTEDAQDVVDEVDKTGLTEGAEAAGSSGGSSSTTISGSGATAGLAVFRQYYQGNKYGSAIGMITGWTNFAIYFVGAIAIAALVYAGFLYLTAAGNDEQTGKAKKIIIWVVIGIIVIFSAYAIVNTLLEGDSSGEGGTSVDVSVGGIDFSYDD